MASGYFSSIIRFVVVSILVLFSSSVAHADCSGPTGVEGEVIYNDDQNLVQFCDGTIWLRMGSSADSRIGSMTSGKWCNTDGTAIICTQDPPTSVAGADKQVQFNDGGSTLAGAAQMFWDKANNRMGVNVNAPTQAVDVSGKVTADSMVLKKIGGAPPPDAAANTAGGSSGQVQFNSGGTALGGDANLFWDNTNKRLGIGMVPALPLDVTGAAIRLTDTTTNAPRFQLSNTAQSWSIYNTAGLSNALSIYDATVNQHRLTIDTSGNVGIGTTGPSEKLEVNGNVKMGWERSTNACASSTSCTATCTGTKRVTGGACRCGNVWVRVQSIAGDSAYACFAESACNLEASAYCANIR